MKVLLSALSIVVGALVASAETVVIPFGGNAYVTNASGAGARITDAGATAWTDPEAIVSVYFATEKPQEALDLSLCVRGNATYEVSCGNEKFIVPAAHRKLGVATVGRVRLASAGYHRVDIRALEKGEGEKDFGEISDLILDGLNGKATFVGRNFSTHWGRRGPSIYSLYAGPEGKHIAYFYNEVLVPEGEDTLYTFYMACGFGQGYFGIQTNSPTERRVLFSVWSPFSTHDPKSVPEADRVRLVKSGEGVTVRDFGGEGSGGQSFLRYPWKAGTTYRMLVGAKPLADGGTRYSGWFYAPEEGKWRLVASFVRPRTQSWVRGTCSFLENFSPESGWKERRVLYKNQWAMDTEGKWHELTTGGFMGDGTAGAKVRLDFAGALTEDGSAYELRNCGFFVGNTDMKAKVKRKGTGTPPDVDVEALEKML
ncbi:MAG: DUF3472 domain-containing protein [Candidatus Spyradosoma sp.]